MPDQFEQYYKYLKANGADVAPDFNSFKNTLSNYDNASKYYTYLKDNQFDVPESYDSFADTFGLKKKDGGIVSGPIPSKLPSKGVLEQGIEMAQKGFVVKPQEQSTFSKVEQSLGKVKNAYDAIQYLKDAPPEFGGVSKEDEQLANQNYANAEKEKQNLLKTYSKDIYSSVDDLLSNNGYKNLFDGNVFNVEKARGILDEKVKARGGGSFLRETLLAELKKRAQSDFDKPVMDKLVQDEFKAAGINVDSLMSKYGKDLFNKLSAKQQSILPIIKQEAEKESVGVLNNAKEIANSLGSDFTNYVNDLNNKIKTGQIDEQTAKQLFDEKKSEYDNGLAKLNEDYQKMVRNVNVKINDRFGRIENEMKKISSSITSEDVFKALPPKDRQKIEEVYSRASQKLAERKNQIVRASDAAIGVPQFAGKALISGFNKGLADIGGYLQMNGSDNKFTDWLLNREQTAEAAAIGQYEWNGKDWYKRAIGGSMQSIGASAPMLLPTLAVGLATQGRVLPAVSGALAGYVSYKGESMQNAGDAYKQRLAETGDVNKAYESASRVERNNKITLPFYFIGGLGTMKLLQGGGKIGSFLSGAALEQAEEIPTEYIQEYNQAKENGYNKGWWAFVKENPEIAVDTLVTTLGQSGAMSAVSMAISKIDTSASQPTIQFYADLIKNEGVQFANSVLQNYYNTGVIDEKKFQEQKMQLLKVAQSMQKVQNLGVSPEKAQVVTILNANVEDLKKQVEEETDQAAKVILEGKLRQAQADLRGISDNTTPYLVLTLPGGQNSTRIMTMQEYEQLKEEGKIDGIIQAADKVRVVNDNELDSEVNKIKEKVGNPAGTADGAYTGGKPAEEFSSVMPYVIEDRDIVEPVIQKIQNNELVNEEDLYEAAQVLEKLQSETDNQSLKNLINPLIDKILTYENQSKTEVSTVTEKGAVTRVGTDVGKKTVSKALGQFEGSRATITDRNGKKVTGYLKLENGTYNLYDENGNQIESIGEKQITDRDVVLPSTDVVPNPIELDENGNIKSITLQLQKVNEEIGILPDRLITIEFQDAEKALDYAIQLRAEQVGEFSDPEFEEIITQVENEIPIKKEVKVSEPKAEDKSTEVNETDIESVSDELLTYLGIDTENQTNESPLSSDNVLKNLETKGVKTSDEKSLKEIKERNKNNTLKTKIIDQAIKAINALKSIFPNMDIYLHDNDADHDYVNEQLGNPKGTVGSFSFIKNPDGTYTGRIDINLNKANGRTIAHEVTHAILEKTFGENKKLFKSFREKISSVLSDDTNKRLSSFSDNEYYASTDDSHEEYLAELSGALSDSNAKINASTLEKVASVINQFVSKLTNGKFKPFEDVKNTKDVVDFFNKVSQSIREGQDLSNISKDYEGKLYEQQNLNVTGKLEKDLPSTGRKPKAKSAIKEGIEVEDYPIIDKNSMKGKRYSVTMSDHTKVGEYNNPKTGVKVANLMGGVFYPYIKGIKDAGIGWASVTVKAAREMIQNAANQDATLVYRMSRSTGSRGNQNFKEAAYAELIRPVVEGKVTEKEFLKQLNNKLNTVSGGKQLVAGEDFLNKYGTDTKEKITIGVFDEQGKRIKDKTKDVVKKEITSLDKLKAALDKESFSKRGAFWSTLMKDSWDKKSTGTWYKFLEENSVASLDDIANNLAEPDVDNAADHDIVAAIKIAPPEYITDKKGNKIIKIYTTRKDLVNEEKGIFFIDAPNHLSYPYVVKGEPIGIFNEFNHISDYFPSIKTNLEFDKLKNNPYKAVETKGKDLVRTLEPKEVELSITGRNPNEIKSKSQLSEIDQNNKIREFIEIQRKKGLSDKEIKAGIEGVSDKIGLDKSKIDDLFKKEAETAAITYKDLSRIEKRKIINSKFDELLKELKIEKICP